MKPMQIFAASTLVLALNLSAAAQETPFERIDEPTEYYEGVAAAAAVRLVLFSETPYATSFTQAGAFGEGDDEDLAELHGHVSKNLVAQAALAGAGLSTSDVVAVAVVQDGALILYVDDL